MKTTTPFFTVHGVTGGAVIGGRILLPGGGIRPDGNAGATAVQVGLRCAADDASTDVTLK